MERLFTHGKVRQIEWWQDLNEISLFDSYPRAVHKVDRRRSAEKLGRMLLEDFRRFLDPRTILDVILSDGLLPSPNPKVVADVPDQAESVAVIIRARAEIVRQSWRWVVLR